MKKIYFILSYLSLVNAFCNLVSLNNITPKKNFCLNMQDNVNLKSFDKIDTDKSGTLDENELKKYYGNTDLLKLGDLNNDKKIDYAEFERIVNIAKFGLENGGNLYVRNAIKFGFLKKDSILADGEASIIVGNKGFDPLNCASDIETLKMYRESEIKHGRLAMLASIGWPISELFHPYLSEITHRTNLLSSNNKVPSILNGGLEKINPVFFMAIIIFTTTIESVELYRSDKNYIPGDLDFDPLNFYKNKTPFTKRNLELKELNNGRLAMLAITYFAFYEYFTNNPIIKNTVLQ
jgi:hypothetical protein